MRFEEIKALLIDPGAKSRRPRFSKTAQFGRTCDWKVESVSDFERAVS